MEPWNRHLGRPRCHFDLGAGLGAGLGAALGAGLGSSFSFDVCIIGGFDRMSLITVCLFVCFVIVQLVPEAVSALGR